MRSIDQAERRCWCSVMSPNRPTSKQMVNKVVGKFGGIDILVNNAALTDHANIFDSTEEEFDKVIAVSLKGRIW